MSFQFVTATVSFIGAIIISQKTNLFLASNLGYHKNYVLFGQVPRDWSQQKVIKWDDWQPISSSATQKQCIYLMKYVMQLNTRNAPLQGLDQIQQKR